MVVNTYWWAKAFISAFNKEIDWSAGVKINATLHTNTFAPNQDTGQYLNPGTSNQLATANGYTNETGADTGFPVVSPAITNTLNVVTLDCDNPQWTASGAGFTARRIVWVDVTTGVDTTDPLLFWSDFGVDETASGGGTFTYAVDGAGIATITPADAAGFP